jgi:hypothetical protein
LDFRKSLGLARLCSGSLAIRATGVVMTPGDAIHRLRIRAANATNDGEHALAADLRAAIAVIERLSLDAQFAHRPPATAK